MKKIALFLILLAWLTPPNAEPSSVFWDISGDSRMGLEEVICTLQSTAELRIDKKVGLPDALYVLKILAGSEGNAEETGMFRAYRADVLEQLQRAAKDETAYLSEFDEYTTDLSDRLPNVCISSPVPGVRLDISVSQDKRYFKLTASHENIKGYVWSFDSNLIFAENDIIVSDVIDAYGLDAAETFKVYREDVIQELIIVRKNEEAYKSEYDSYTDKLSDLGYNSYPFVHIEILAAANDYFKLKGTHDKVPNYVWTYDSATGEFMENGVVYTYVPPQIPENQCRLYFQVTGAIKQFLGNILKSEEAYYASHQVYTDKLSDLGLSVPSTPDGITFEIQLGNNGQSYIAKGTHPILDCVWTINEKEELVKVPK